MLTRFHIANYRLLLPISIGIIISLILFTSILSVIKMNSISKQMISTNKKHATSNTLIHTMTKSVLSRAALLQETIHSNNFPKRTLAIIQHKQLKTSYTEAKASLLEHQLTDQQVQLIKKQEILEEKMSLYENAIYTLLLRNSNTETQSIYTRHPTTEAQNIYNHSPLLKNILKNIKTLRDISNIDHKIGQQSFNDLKNSSDTTLQQVLVSMVTVFLISMLLALFVIVSQRVSSSKLTKLANSDSLTGLPNRSSLIKNVEDSLHNSPGSIFALIFLDIDYFKSINDNYGHDIGDEILKQFSAKIAKTLSSNDILSRFGGDEFVVLVKSICTKAEAVSLVRSLSKSLDTSFIIDNKEIFTSSSIGATIYMPDETHIGAKKLLNQADNAMYVAKESGRNCFKFFSKENHKKMQREHAIEHSLHTILKNNNRDNYLFMKYQPLYDLRSDKIAGFEALIRWGDTNKTIIPTDVFIRIAEKTTLIEKVNLLVIKEVCKQKLLWNKAGIDPYVKINFNLSGNNKSIDFLLNAFIQEMQKYGLKPYEFGLELTERTILDVNEETAELMKKLKNQGLKISIDDFGTGYSSLSYLKKLPITTIKIDKSFINGLPYDHDDIELVKTIITLGKSFKLDIIAEGVENIQQLNFLSAHSCKYAQGFFLNRPLNTNDIKKIKSSEYISRDKDIAIA